MATLDIEQETFKEDFAKLGIQQKALKEDFVKLGIQQKAFKEDFAIIPKTLNIICRGEIINAVLAVLGYTSVSEFSRSGFFEYIESSFLSVYRFIRQTIPDRTEDEVRSRLKVINASHENCYINGRNAAAHRITLEQARKSAADKDRPYLLMWVDYLAAFENDQQACISDVAFRNEFHPSSQIVERNEMDSMVEPLIRAPHEVQLNFRKTISHCLGLYTKQQKLDQAKDDEVLMEAAGISSA